MLAYAAVPSPDDPSTDDLLTAIRDSEWRAGRASLASRFSHDLGTPLNVILGRANLISAADDSEDGPGRHAKLIADAARSMADMLKDLVAEEALRPERQEVEAEQLLQHATSLALGTSASIDVRFEDAAAASAVMHIDPTLTTHLLSDLLFGIKEAEGLAVEAALEVVERPDDLRCAPGRFLRVRLTGRMEEVPEPDPRRAHTQKHLLRALGGFLRDDSSRGSTVYLMFLPTR